MKGYLSFYSTSITGKTQAAGAQTIDVSDSYSSILDTGKERLLALKDWQIQCEVSGETNSGEISIGIKSPGATGFSTHSTAINLASPTKMVTFSAIAEEIQLTPSAFDGVSYSAYLIAS